MTQTLRALLVGLVLALAGPAWAGHVYINPASCGPNPSAVAAGWSDAVRLDNIGTWHNYVTYQFNQLSNPGMVCHFTMPEDNTSGQFTAQIDMRGSINNPGLYFWFGLAGAANVRGEDYNEISPENTGFSSTLTAAIGPTAGLSFVATISPVVITDGLTGNQCATEGVQCLSRPAVLWIWRLTNNDVCFDSNRPFSCCTGLQTGNCIVGTPYTGSEELISIDLRY